MLTLVLLGAALAAPLPTPVVHERMLANGMKFLVVEDQTFPVFSAVIRFRVGGVDERPGLTGTSHLLEHMLFKGTKRMGTWNYAAEAAIMAKIDAKAGELVAEQRKLQNPRSGGDAKRVEALRDEIAKLQAEQKKYIVKDEFWETYVRNGGSFLNASTSEDGTQYFVSLPSNRLELWMFMESDRIPGTVLREFYSERDVVFEERRLRTDTSPNGKLWEAIGATAFFAHPYGAPVVGWAGDLHTVTREQVEAYYRMTYAPNNAIAAVVGDVDAKQVFAMAERYFAPIPAQTPPPPVFTDEPEQEGERRCEVEFDAKAQMMLGWHTPGVAHADAAALDVLSSVLSMGRTSRFFRGIEEKKIGVSVSANASEQRYPSLFVVSGAPVAPKTCADLEAAIETEIDAVRRGEVTDWEVARTRNQIRANYIRSQQRPIGIAFQLTDAEAVAGDWRYASASVENQIAVTREDLSRVAKLYLTKRNRTVVTLIPTKSAQPKAPVRLRPGQLHHGRGSGGEG